MLFRALSLAALVASPALALPQARWVRRQENAQTSLTLDPAVISPGLAQDGQGDNPDPGQVRSLTTTNNYINFCLTQNVPLTNGQQIPGGSCNQTPMGQIIPLDNSPRCKFVFPRNGDTSLVANTPFTVQLKIQFMQTGAFTNPASTYYAAPQQLNGNRVVIGHSHVVIEELPSLQHNQPLDPTTFKFFKGLNNQADGQGILTAEVTDGLAAGAYRICSINTAANHQAVIVSNAQHGSLDDCVYFTVNAPGQQGNNGQNNNNGNNGQGQNNNNNNGQNNNGQNNNGNGQGNNNNNGQNNNGQGNNGQGNNNGQNNQQNNGQNGQNNGQNGQGNNGQNGNNNNNQNGQNNNNGQNGQGQGNNGQGNNGQNGQGNNGQGNNGQGNNGQNNQQENNGQQNGGQQNNEGQNNGQQGNEGQNNGGQEDAPPAGGDVPVPEVPAPAPEAPAEPAPEVPPAEAPPAPEAPASENQEQGQGQQQDQPAQENAGEQQGGEQQQQGQPEFQGQQGDN